MMDRAAFPNGVPACISARSISPVEIAGIPNQFVISRDCVPLPLPGGPKSRRTTLPPLSKLQSTESDYLTPPGWSSCYHRQNPMKKLILLCLIGGSPWCFAETLELKAGPKTVVWGYYSASAKPVLTIHSNDTVRIETVSGNPARLEAADVPPAQIPEALRAIYKEVTDKGPAGRHLTGPIFEEVAG